MRQSSNHRTSSFNHDHVSPYSRERPVGHQSDALPDAHDTESGPFAESEIGLLSVSESMRMVISLLRSAA
jgi:hypothetical protein